MPCWSLLHAVRHSNLTVFEPPISHCRCNSAEELFISGLDPLCASISYGQSGGPEASSDTDMQHPGFDERFLSFTSLDESSLRRKASRGSSSGGLADMFAAQGTRTPSPDSLDFAMMVQPLEDPLECGGGSDSLSPDRDWVSAYMRESNQEDDRRTSARHQDEAKGETWRSQREQDAARHAEAGTESTAPLSGTGRPPPHPHYHQQQQQRWNSSLSNEEQAAPGPRHYSFFGPYGPPPYMPVKQDAGLNSSILNTPQGTFANPILPFQHLPPVDHKRTDSLPLSAAQATLRNFLQPQRMAQVQDDQSQQTQVQAALASTLSTNLSASVDWKFSVLQVADGSALLEQPAQPTFARPLTLCSHQVLLHIPSCPTCIRVMRLQLDRLVSLFCLTSGSVPSAGRHFSEDRASAYAEQSAAKPGPGG